MMGSWFFNGNFNGVSDDFFDNINCLDFPLEDVEGNNDEDWDAQFECVAPPPLDVLEDLSSGFCAITSSDTSVCRKNDSVLRDDPSNCKPLHASRSIQRPADSCEGNSHLSFSSSPVSVLESSNVTIVENCPPLDSKVEIPLKHAHCPLVDPKVEIPLRHANCSLIDPKVEIPLRHANRPPIDPKVGIPVKRARSKRTRPLSFKPRLTLPNISTAPFKYLAAHELNSESCDSSETQQTEKVLNSARRKLKKKKNLSLLSNALEIKKNSHQPVATRKCLHCETTKTPQWREGPEGPKTLCNACGVRYRTGRLCPEYRPAASPTFVASLHSNTHKKVLELRSKGSSAITSAATNGMLSPLVENPFG